MSKAKEEVLVIKPIKMATVKIKIVGLSPLMVHRWDEKAIKLMEDAQAGRGKAKAKESREPFRDFIDSAYWIKGKPTEYTQEALDKAYEDGALTGFPLTAIKQSANSAAYRLGWVKNQMGLRGTYFLNGDFDRDLGTIQEKPEFRRDTVRVGMGSADLRYRAFYPKWSMEFNLEYNVTDAANIWSLENILTCIEAGGQTVGIGEWRPEKDGDFGRFRVERVSDHR